MRDSSKVGLPQGATMLRGSNTSSPARSSNYRDDQSESRGGQDDSNLLELSLDNEYENNNEIIATSI